MPSAHRTSHNDGVWIRLIWIVLGILLFVRVGYLLVFPLDVIPDEGYYWDWSRQLDWAYYSKPPLIAWVHWLGTLPGDSAFWLKLPAALTNVAGIGVLAALATRMYHAKAGFWTAIVSATMPGTVIGGWSMTIDAPLLLAWSLALFFAWGALANKHRIPPAGWAFGTASAVGVGLLAKLSMGLFWVGVLLFWLFPGHKHRSGWISPWIGWAFFSALFLVPFFWWNYQMDWITFSHTGASFGVDSWSLPVAFGRGLEFVGSQFGALNPIWYALIFLLGFGCLRNWKKLDRRARFLATFSIPFILGATLLAFYQRVQPNWPAPFYISITVLLGAWLSGERFWNWKSSEWDHSHKRWRTFGTSLGIALVIFIYLAPTAWEQFGYAGHRSDPFARLRGWNAFAQEVQEVRTKTFGSLPHFLWVGGHRYNSSQLAFYLPDQPHVFRFSSEADQGGSYGAIQSQYELWDSPLEAGLINQNALVLLEPNLAPQQIPILEQHFQQLNQIGLIQFEIGHGRTHQLLALQGISLSP